MREKIPGRWVVIIYNADALDAGARRKKCSSGVRREKKKTNKIIYYWVKLHSESVGTLCAKRQQIAADNGTEDDSKVEYFLRQ